METKKAIIFIFEGSCFYEKHSQLETSSKIMHTKANLIPRPKVAEKTQHTRGTSSHFELKYQQIISNKYPPSSPNAFIPFASLSSSQQSHTVVCNA